MGSVVQPELAEAMQKMWEKFLPQIEARISVLEDAAAALAADLLSLEQRAAANAAAHKLAGVLGSFGLTKGTILAREIEIAYSGEPETDPADSHQLLESTHRLRTLVEARKSTVKG